MLKFKNIREKAKGKKPAGKLVFDKKLNGVKVNIYKDNNSFVAYIDGDKLDSYKNQKQAEKMAAEIVKELK